MSTLQFTMPSKVEAIEPIMQAIGPVISESLPPDEDAQVDLALREALANAIIHGNREDSRKKVRVFCSARRGTVDLMVRDEGPGFDPSHVADPRKGEGLLSGHGRGVYLMRAMMDHVKYGKNGREVYMRKTAPGS